MKFDVSKYKAGPSYYQDMTPEQLAFHDALGRRIWEFGKEIEYFGPSKTHKHIKGIVRINNDGTMKPEILLGRCKSKTVDKMLEEINDSIADIIEFYEVCDLYGYIIHEPPRKLSD